MERVVAFMSLAVLIGASGCKHAPATTDVPPQAEEPMARAESAAPPVAPLSAAGNIEARSGSSLAGEVTFTEEAGVTRIVVTVRNAPPGMHAVHVHEIGDCSSPDGKSAGPHFNPDGHQHGAPTDQQRHAGDLGNMEVAEDGTGTLEMVSKDLTVADGPRSVVGRSIIVHDKADDFVTQPTGAAGGRIGCGEIAR